MEPQHKLKPGKKETRFGIDIGTRLVKAVEVSLEGNVKKLLKLHQAEIPSPPTEQKTGAAIKSLLDDLKPSVKDVNISLSSPHAIVRFISMPRMKESDLLSSLHFEAEKYIPFNIKEVVIDAVILGDSAEDKKQMNVLFAAAKKDVVNSRIELLKKNGLSPSIIDIDSFACFNAFSNSREGMDTSLSIALLNIGYTQTNLIISRESKPFFTRDIQLGGRDMAKFIAEKLKVPHEESDKLIFGHKERSAEVLEAAKPALENLTDELKLSFGYYENQHGKTIDEIYVSGGTAHLEGICKYFEKEFGAKTMSWNPFSKFEISPAIDAKLLKAREPQFAVSAGLAMRK